MSVTKHDDLLCKLEERFAVKCCEGTRMERARRVWDSIQSTWLNARNWQQLKEDLRKSSAILKRLVEVILDPEYSQSSRTRWLCTLKTMVRLRVGILILLLYADQRHVYYILRLAPICVHRVVAQTHALRQWIPGLA